MSNQFEPAPDGQELLPRVMLRALWVARVPVASIVVAFALFLNVPQVQDLLIELKLRPLHTLLYWTGFFVFSLLFWVLPVHFSSRVALQLGHQRIGIDTQQRYVSMVIWLPRLLGVLCLLAICIGIWQAYLHVPGSANSDISTRASDILRINAIVATGLVFVYLLAFKIWSTSKALWQTRRIAPRLFPVLRRFVRSLRVKKAGPQTRHAHLMANATFLTKKERLIQRNTLISVSFFLGILWVLSLVVWGIYIAVPYLDQLGWRVPLTDKIFSKDLFFEYVLPRSILLPTILGLFVPFLTFVSILSHKLRHPLLIYGVAIFALLSVIDKHRHDVRVIEHPLDGGQTVKKIAFKTALDKWKAVNCSANNQICRPIIVAAEGGASRAAFFTASVLAHMQDKSKNFSKNLFAVVGVSGGALGAAAFVAAQKADETSSGKNDLNCNDGFCGWFGWHVEKTGQLPPTGSLTRAVQLFLANDFLSPPLAAYVFHDMFKLGSIDYLQLPNRVVWLEQSWETHFKRKTGSNNFAKPFSSFAPSLDAGSASSWQPLMVFYGSSIETGRRVMVSSLASTYKTKSKSGRIFQDSYDLYEMMCEGKSADKKDGTATCRCKQDGNSELPTCDVSLSTAVTTSARFPLISAHGNIVGEDRQMVSQVIDGGFFDYFAITAAVELAQVMREHDDTLKPLILLISNDPGAFPEQCDTSTRSGVSEQSAPPRPKIGTKFFKSIRDPLDTVLNSRIARARHGAASVERLKNIDHKSIIVCPQRLNTDRADRYKQLSMSWWLSAPVQEYLNDQLYSKGNKKVMQEIIDLLH